MSKTKHLYIHIPFCKSICTYCNFKKEIYEENKANLYIKKMISEIEKTKNKFKTIYIGGGTPNCLNHSQLELILKALENKKERECELTIELNPEFICQEQINLFLKYKVNRFSLGVQSLNNKILNVINRSHNLDTINKAINLLQKNKLENISCDFIINLPYMNNDDIDKIIDFINLHKLKHVSIYCLELKHNSILEKLNYKINEDREAEQLEYLNKLINEKTKLKQYEISNWSINEKYQSKHNLSYWNMNDWIGLGYGACGYENMKSYENIGNIYNWKKRFTIESKEEYYKTILIMGLRQTKGIDLSIKKNLEAFNYYKQKLNKKLYTIKNNHLIAKNIYLLNNLLIDIF